MNHQVETGYHEASHVVFEAGILGREVLRISIAPGTNASGARRLGHVESRGEIKQLPDFSTCTWQPRTRAQVLALANAASEVAGEVGSAITRGEWLICAENTCRLEIVRAREIVAKAFPHYHVDFVLQDVANWTRRFLAAPLPWAAVEAVANALLEHRTLDGRAALAIAHRAAAQRAHELRQSQNKAAA